MEWKGNIMEWKGGMVMESVTLEICLFTCRNGIVVLMTPLVIVWLNFLMEIVSKNTTLMYRINIKLFKKVLQIFINTSNSGNKISKFYNKFEKNVLKLRVGDET